MVLRSSLTLVLQGTKIWVLCNLNFNCFQGRGISDGDELRMQKNAEPRLHSEWCGFCSLSLALLSEFIICNLKAFLSSFIFRSPLARMILSWARALMILALWDPRNLLKFLSLKIFFPRELCITVCCLPMGSPSKLDSVKGDPPILQLPLRL